MCIFSNFIIWEIKLQISYLIWGINFVPTPPLSPSTHPLLPWSSYPWLPMVVSLFLTHLLLEVVSPITFPPSPFCYHWSSRNKGLYWWRRSKGYKLHMELHQLQWWRRSKAYQLYMELHYKVPGNGAKNMLTPWQVYQFFQVVF